MQTSHFKCSDIDIDIDIGVGVGVGVGVDIVIDVDIGYLWIAYPVCVVWFCCLL